MKNKQNSITKMSYSVPVFHDIIIWQTRLSTRIYLYICILVYVSSHHTSSADARSFCFAKHFTKES